MHKMLKRAALASVASIAMMGGAFADEERKFGYSLSLTAVSDYLFRGISLTNEKPAFQPYLEFTYGIAYVGFWLSNVGDRQNLDFSYLGPVEIDYYAGLRPVTGPINWDLGVMYYTYDCRLTSCGFSDVSYVEFKAAATTSPVKNLTLGLTGYVTPDQGTAAPVTWTLESSAAYAIPTKLWMFDPTISGGLGYSNADRAGWFLGEDDYLYWNVGLKLTVDKFFMDFRYWDTNISGGLVGGLTGKSGDDQADSRFLFSAGVTLP